MASTLPRRLHPALGLLLAAFLVALWPGPARADLSVNITDGVVKPLPIAIGDFYAEGPETADLGQRIAAVISDNLERSGLFQPIDRRLFLAAPASVHVTPDFSIWQRIEAQGLVTGEVVQRSDGSISIAFRLWDVFAAEDMEGLEYITTRENWRRIAHAISDRIYQRLTGESGYFATRVVYVSESGRATERVKRLAIMDQDGANHRFLTDGANLVLTPRFSPTGSEITYLAQSPDGVFQVHLLDTDTLRRELLARFDGISIAPRFSPDGNQVILSLISGGDSDIYAMDLRTRQLSRLTQHPAIDTSPSYSPDGQRVVFESDRGGSQQLYTMRADGSNVTRITFGDGRYANPVWSPRGDLIAFTRIHRNQFYIGVIEWDGTNERMLTQAFHVEGPTWAPNGRVLMYFKEEAAPGGRSRQARLYTIDITGRNERRVETPTGASDPAWSPLY